MGYLLYAVQSADVVEGVDAGRETAVKTEDLILDQGGERQEIEKIGEVLPDIRISVFPEALVVKAVDLGDLTRLVIASQDGDALGVSNF